VGATPLTKHESDPSNSAKWLQNHDKNPIFTIPRTTYIIDVIVDFLPALARLRLVNSDSGRLPAATIV
jgi:hypothetical protein